MQTLPGLPDVSLDVVIFQPCCCTLPQHPCPTRVSFRSDSRSEQVLELRLAFSGQPSPRQAAPGCGLSGPAGRIRPRGPGSLYTVRPDLNSHSCLDVMRVT